MIKMAKILVPQKSSIQVHNDMRVMKINDYFWMNYFFKNISQFFKLLFTPTLMVF